VAITKSQIKYGPVNSGSVYTSGVLDQVFSAGTVGGATDYRLVEIRNASALTWTSPVAYLSIDTGGAAYAIAVADTGIARDMSYSYSEDPTALTYSTPTTEVGGLALPTLAAGQKCLVAIRRTLSGASPAPSGENNILNVDGDSPT
jgi:hypothetical protein